MLVLRCLIIAYLLWGLSTRGLAQQYQLNTLNIYEGFSKGLVKDISTDALGFVWLASDQGLIRFDGAEAAFYKDELTGGFAKALLRRKDGRLIVAYDLGITEIHSLPDTAYFDPLIAGQLSNSDSTVFYPKSLYESTDGQLWIGENTALANYSAGRLKKYYFSEKDHSYNIFRNFSCAENGQGRLWVLSFPGFLYYFDAAADRFVEVPFDCRLEEVSDFIALNDSTFWATAKNGLFEITVNAQLSVSSCRQIPGIENISCAILVDQKNCYLGTWDKGLYYLHLDGIEKGWEKINFLPFEQVVAMRYDSNNGLWVSGNDNIALLTPTFFKTYQFDLSEIPVEAIKLRADSSLLIGSGNQLYNLRPSGKEWEVEQPLVLEADVATAFELQEDTLWMGMLSGELSYLPNFQETGQSVTSIPAATTSITDILYDKNGNVWAAGNNSVGLIQRSPEGEFHFFDKNGLQNSRTIFESPSGTLLVGGGYDSSYLFFYSPLHHRFQDISVPFPFPVSKNFVVEDIALHRNGDVLLATSDGLLQYSMSANGKGAERISRIDLYKVPINEPIKAITIAEDGTYWLSTTSGLIAYNGFSSLLFDKNSGLPSNNLTYRGLQLDAQQNLWVATSKGVSLFQKNSINNSQTPQPIIKNIRINKSQVPYGADLVVQVPFNSGLEINFQCLSYPVKKLKYQTRILEVDTDWSKPGSAAYALMSGLVAGSYTFQVRAQQGGGYLWSEAQTVSFKINRPWYQHFWALITFLLLFIGILYAIARIYNWTLIQQNEKLEQTIQERTVEIKQQQKEIIEQNEQFRQLQEAQLQQEIDYKNKQLTTYTLHMIQKNEALRELQQKIFSSIRGGDKGKSSQADLKSFLSVIDFSFHKDREWNNFKLYFEKVHVGFFETLKKQYPELSLLELRHCALIRLNLSISETATILGISADSVKTARFRIRKKMNINSQPEMMDAIMRI